ncbi:MAG: flippase [Candidatus Moranbacteria bacterium]|nr:flippase [Candidatus Moranbacteria bacterium]
MKKFSQALVWLTLSEIIFMVAGYAIQSMVGRILGPADYGRYSLIVTLTTMVIILIGNGIPTAMSKYLAEIFESAPERILGIKHQAMRLQILLMSAVTVLFFLAAPLIAHLLHDPSLTPLFRLSSLIIPAFAAASFYFYYYTGLHFFRLQAGLKMMRALGRVVFIIGFAYFFGVQGAISGYIAAPLFVFTLALLADIFITHRYFPHVKQSKPEVIAFSSKTILAYAGPLTLFLLFYEFILTLDLYFVKSLLQSDYLTGIYNAAITAGRIPYYLFYALTIILLPAISKTTAERDTKETENLVNKALRLMIFLLFPMVTLLMIYAPQVLHLFYGNQYAAAVQPLRIYAFGVGFLTVFYVLSFALNGAGLVKIPLKLAFFGFFSMIGLNFLFIPKWSLIGAALSTTFVSIAVTLAILIAIERHFRVRLAPRTLLVSIGSVGALIVLTPFLPNGSYSFLLSGALLTLIYFFLLRLSGELKDTDIDPILKLWQGKR